MTNEEHAKMLLHRIGAMPYFDEQAIQKIIVDEFAVIKNQAAAELARITAERARYRHDLARAIAWIDERASFSEADKFAGTTLFETWQEVQAALKSS